MFNDFSPENAPNLRAISRSENQCGNPDFLQTSSFMTGKHLDHLSIDETSSNEAQAQLNISGRIKALSSAELFKLYPRSPAPIQVSHQTLVLTGILKTPFPSWSYCTFSSSYLCVLSRQHRVSGRCNRSGHVVDDLGAWSREVQVDSWCSDVLNGIIPNLREV